MTSAEIPVIAPITNIKAVRHAWKKQPHFNPKIKGSLRQRKNRFTSGCKLLEFHVLYRLGLIPKPLFLFISCTLLGATGCLIRLFSAIEERVQKVQDYVLHAKYVEFVLPRGYPGGGNVLL
jgi:hypothetical protein